VVVAFETPQRAWILLVGPHNDHDPVLNVYAELYRLLGAGPPLDARRAKPPRCDEIGELPPVLGDALPRPRGKAPQDKAVPIRAPIRLPAPRERLAPWSSRQPANDQIIRKSSQSAADLARWLTHSSVMRGHGLHFDQDAGRPDLRVVRATSWGRMSASARGHTAHA
jgi:hypothetical protein